jgi:uncharacterized membrane protein YheB (UPF0754 family)
VGTINPEQLDRLKAQITKVLLNLMQGEDTMRGISAYITDTLQKLRPHSIDSIMRIVHPESEARLKSMLSKGLLSVISRPETSNIINSVLASQIERLMSAPIGKLSDHIAEDRIREASVSLTDAIITAVHQKLPDAIREFNVGGVVKEKIQTYPAEKLEALVLSVAKEHLRTIELFGALFGFFIGVLQAIQFYIYAR